MNNLKNKKLSLADKTSGFWQGQNSDANTNIKAILGISEEETESIQQQYGIELPETFKILYQQSNGTIGLDPFQFMFWPLEIIKQKITTKDDIVWISFCEYFGLYTFAIGINKSNQQTGIYRFDKNPVLVANSFNEFLTAYLYQHETLLLPVDQTIVNAMDYFQHKTKVLGALENRILQHQGKFLFKELMADMKNFSYLKIMQQEMLMKCLENWWDHNIFVASYLMARLLPEAGKIIDNHTIYNAIELYLTSASNYQVKRALEILLEETDISSRYKRKYQRLAY